MFYETQIITESGSSYCSLYLDNPLDIHAAYREAREYGFRYILCIRVYDSNFDLIAEG